MHTLIKRALWGTLLATATTTGDDSILGGTQIVAPITAPVTVGGNAVSVVGESTSTTPGGTIDPVDPTDPATPGTPGTTESAAALSVTALAATGGTGALPSLLISGALIVAGLAARLLRYRSA